MTFEEKLELQTMILESKKIDFIELITKKLKTTFENLKPIDRINIVNKLFFYADMPNRIEA